MAAAFDKEQTEMNRRIIEDLYTTGSAEWSKSLINRTLNEDIVKGHNLLADFNMHNFSSSRSRLTIYWLLLEVTTQKQK